jgi:hypothetical protein
MAMAELSTKTASLRIDGFFKKPVLFKDAHCDEIAQKSLDTFYGYGLRPSQITVRRGDEAYSYDLSFSLFNGNGTFKILSEKMELGLQGIASAKDLEIVADCVSKFYQQVLVPEIGATNIEVNAQTVAASAEVRDQYLSRFADASKQITRTGAVIYVRCNKWPEEIRMLVDRSLLFLNDGLFLMWTTTFAGNKLTMELMANLENACEEAANKLDLVFKKPNPQ